MHQSYQLKDKLYSFFGIRKRLLGGGMTKSKLRYKRNNSCFAKIGAETNMFSKEVQIKTTFAKNNNERQIGPYELFYPSIGKGGYGEVYKAINIDETYTAQPKFYAIKKIRKDRIQRNQICKIITREIENNYYVLLNKNKAQRHANIVYLEEVITTYSEDYLVMEYCAGGSLKDYMKRKLYNLSEQQVHHFMKQIAEGLHQFYVNGIIHRDLKPQNLLLQDFSDFPILKIADLGLSKNTKKEQLGKSDCGTKHYKAPEIFQKKKYNYKVDL